jgi:hypothetical protein
MTGPVKTVAAVIAWTLMFSSATICLMAFCNEYLSTGWDLIDSFVVMVLLCIVFGWGKADIHKRPHSRQK